MAQKAPRYARPALSLIEDEIGHENVSLYIGGADAARDISLLGEHNITTVVNCAVNLDINYVENPNLPADGDRKASGSAPVRTYKIGLVDGDGNPEKLMLAGYYILESALEQRLPEKASYPVRERGNVLVHCRGGRSRSVALVALFLHKKKPQAYPTYDDALKHIREKRELHPDEWFETPKQVLTDIALRASDDIESLK